MPTPGAIAGIEEIDVEADVQMRVRLDAAERFLHDALHAHLVDVAHVVDVEARVVHEFLLAGVDRADADLADASTRAIAGALPPSSVSSRGPLPHRHATGMPWTLPDGVIVLVLKSACASSQRMRSFLPRSRQ